MRKRFTHPIAIGGYGTIIVTLVIFFAQGGFGKMTLLTTLYIIGLIIGLLATFRIGRVPYDYRFSN